MKKGTFTIKLMLCGTGPSDVYPFEWKCRTALQVIGAYNAIRNMMGHSVKEEEHEGLMEAVLDLKKHFGEDLLLDCNRVTISFDPIDDDQ